jgi:hypothetical protein
MRHCSTGQPVVTSADLYQLAYKHDVFSSVHAPCGRLIEYESATGTNEGSGKRYQLNAA